ncbi:ComC/BlpC family leader-containing pheromone/bacteriocin (plasmid) [Paraclostridium sordellii]|uniref:ComC/BlpC family leader-containing pheromone/bacteriocin n=1 Tax=Paraclostridium sordellii TaxID=1505 RepID=UPI0005E4E5D0|nr:ComC/BlpC family leader-containing pheromone/bacteriocin [Paeniclostridium sordellii]CEP41301.1 Uncharacterised protein [[Clostridium] sordellii] [Paeniclostridium sordellii]
MKNNFKELKTSELENTNGGGAEKVVQYLFGLGAAYLLTHPTNINPRDPRYSANRLT